MWSSADMNGVVGERRRDKKRKLSPTKKATPPGGDGAAIRPERNGQTTSIAHPLV
jgi:hypothetical protein